VCPTRGNYFCGDGDCDTAVASRYRISCRAVTTASSSGTSAFPPQQSRTRGNVSRSKTNAHMSGTGTDDSPDFIGDASRCIEKHSTAQSHDKDLMISIYPLARGHSAKSRWPDWDISPRSDHFHSEITDSAASTDQVDRIVVLEQHNSSLTS
jgi:hypothetical protein